MVISPTPGRVVWFRPGLADPMFQIDAKAPLAAIVVHVTDDRLVNLVVFDAMGFAIQKRDVRLVQEGDDPLPEGTTHCQWMPYQIGQAKRHYADPQPGGAS